jgi:hypothetical protein
MTQLIRLVSALRVASCSCLLATASLVGQARSAELVVRDLSLGLELQPTSFSYQLKDPNGTRSGNDSFSSGYGAYLGSMWSIAGPGDSGGFLVGGELVYDRFAYANGGSETAYGARLLGGYAYALSDRWGLYGIVDAGAGSASLSLNGHLAFSTYRANGLYYSYAARVGISFAVTDRMIIDGDAGYRTNSDNLSAGNTKVSITSSGLCASVGFRYRFSNSPAPLE